jgi:hypothetical protein
MYIYNLLMMKLNTETTEINYKLHILMMKIQYETSL